MKKLLLIFTSLMFVLLISGFKNSTNKTIDLLCNKQWVTNGGDDESGKVFVMFNVDSTYEHKYVIQGETTLYLGKWSIGKDNKIYIKFSETKIGDIYEIVSLDKNKLEIKTTSSGFKKFYLKN